MKKLLSTISLLFIIISFSVAQETIDMAMMQKIKDEGKNNSQITMIALRRQPLPRPGPTPA
ncbi:MAG: hypothetical protein IPP96_12350 [Chitinophagaceae bacterium]|nr:hypothetical protein [Chitinophagaceae bacterium]